MDTQDAAEFPKMLYAGGITEDETGKPVRHDNTRIVHNPEAEAEAREAGFREAIQPEGGDDVLADGEGDDTISGSTEPPAGSATDSDPGHVLQVAGDPGADAFNGADPQAFDHDGDGQPGGAPKGGNKKSHKA